MAADSTTETYVAIRATVDNWRWSGVPFLLRTGKCLARRVTEVAVHFKQPPLSLFRTVECEGDQCDLAAARPNVISFRIQPNEGIHLTFSTKRPGMNLDLQAVQMDFDYGQSFNKSLPEAYERLLLGCLAGRPHAVHERRRGGGRLGVRHADSHRLGECREQGPGNLRGRKLGAARGRSIDGRMLRRVAAAVTRWLERHEAGRV